MDRWIKTSERLPPYGRLVYTRDDKGEIGVYTRYRYPGIGDGWSSYVSTDNNAIVEWLDSPGVSGMESSGDCNARAEAALQTPETEIEDEIRNEGSDPDQVAGRVQEVIRDTLKRCDDPTITITVDDLTEETAHAFITGQPLWPDVIGDDDNG